MNLSDPKSVESRTEKAFEYLEATDKKHAALKSELETSKELLKTIEAFGIVDSEGAMVLRKAQARSSDEYKDHVVKIGELTEAYQLVQNKRTLALGLISLYQTVSANTRRGNI